MNENEESISKLKAKIRYLMKQRSLCEKYLLAHHALIDASFIKMNSLSHGLSVMKGLVKLEGHSKASVNGKTVYGFSSLGSLSSCLYKLNGILTEEGHGFITSLKVNNKISLLKAFDLYQKRWDIENHGFRELKEYWNITPLPKKKFNTVYMHIFLILVMFNTVIAYKSNRKDKFVQKGFLNLVKSNFSYTDEMIICRDGYVGIFSLKESTPHLTGCIF